MRRFGSERVTMASGGRRASARGFVSAPWMVACWARPRHGAGRSAGSTAALRGRYAPAPQRTRGLGRRVVEQIARRALALLGSLAIVGAAFGLGAAVALGAGSAAADTYTTPEDTALVVAAPGVLANDGTPADGMVLCVGAADS